MELEWCVTCVLSPNGLQVGSPDQKDPVVTPEVFAQSIVDDYALGPNYHSVIVKLIQEQLTDYRAHSRVSGQDSCELVETPILRGVLDDFHAQWWEAWRVRTTRTKSAAAISRRPRKKRRLDTFIAETNILVDDVDGLGKSMMVDEFKLDEELVREEMRILIKVRFLSSLF